VIACVGAPLPPEAAPAPLETAPLPAEGARSTLVPHELQNVAPALNSEPHLLQNIALSFG
jgi:hypothetical protein